MTVTESGPTPAIFAVIPWMVTCTPPSDDGSGGAAVTAEGDSPTPGSVTSLFGANTGRAVK